MSIRGEEFETNRSISLKFRDKDKKPVIAKTAGLEKQSPWFFRSVSTASCYLWHLYKTYDLPKQHTTKTSFRILHVESSLFTLYKLCCCCFFDATISSSNETKNVFQES